MTNFDNTVGTRVWSGCIVVNVNGYGAALVYGGSLECTRFAPTSSNFREAPDMATVVAGPLPQPVSVSKYDRAFYSSIASAMALSALVGFGPTYYFKAFGQGPMPR